MMIDIKGMVNKLEEDGKPTGEERDLLIKSLLLQAKLHNQQGAIALGLLFTSAAQEIEALQAENEKLKALNSTQENLLRASVEWMDKKGCPVPYDFRVAFETPPKVE